MLRRMLAPMLLVFPLVLLLAFFFTKLSEPVEPPPSPEEIKARELAQLRQILKDWPDLPAEARRQAAGSLAHGLVFPQEDLLWETTWALGELGPPAVLELIRLLEQGDAPSHARGHALWALGLVGPEAREALPQVKAALADPHPDVRGHAAFALSQIETSAAEAVPALLPLFADSTPDVVEAAGRACARYGEAAVPVLRQGLADPSAAVRKQSIVTLGMLGERGGAAVADLIAIVRDPDDPLRTEAAEALGQIGAPALTALADALKDPSAAVRLQAADALGRIGRSALATLTPAIQDENVNVRLQALTGLAPFADEVVEPVAAASRDSAPAVRELAVQVLALVRQPAARERAVPPLVAALADPEPNVRRQAILALRRLQPPADQVLPLVKPLAEHASPEVRADVLTFLYSAGLGNRAVPFLAQALKDSDEKVQALAIKILEEMRCDPVLLYDRVAPLLAERDNEPARVNALNVVWRAGPAAAPAILAALHDPSARVRRMAVWALHQGTLDSETVFPQLLPLQKDPDAGVRASVMTALARHGAAGVPVLAAGLEDSDTEVRVQAATALGYVQANPAEVLPLLEKAIHADREEVRIAAAAALEHVGTPAVDLLLQAFRDPSDKVWKQALRSLIRMPGDNRVLLPILQQALRHEDASVRVGAVYAMERFGGEAVPALVALLQSDPDPNVDWAVVDVIDTIGMPARAAFPHLVEPALKHPVAKVRYGALVAMLKMQALERYREALTLERYQERIGIVVPHLVRALEDRRDAEWRWQAALLLGVIGPPAKEASPALTRALDDSDPRVREAARAALDRIGS